MSSLAGAACDSNRCASSSHELLFGEGYKQMIARKIVLSYCAVAAMALPAGGVFANTSQRAQTFPLRDTSGLIAPKVKTEAVSYLGRKSVRMTMEGNDHAGLALLPGTDFQDGVIEVDIALRN